MHIGPKGADVYRNIVFELNKEKDLLAKGIQLLPGNTKIVHHALVYYLPSDYVSELSLNFNGRNGLSNEEDSSYGFFYPSHTKGFHFPKPHKNGLPRAGMISTYVPGGLSVRLPPDSALRIPAYSQIVVQFHYHRTGHPEDSKSQIGIWLDRDYVEKKTKLLEPYNVHGDFGVIPKGAKDFRVSTTTEIKNNQNLIGILPHAHYLAKWMKYTLIDPDGVNKILLEVPNWDFNWQQTYYFNKPLKLRAGSRIEAAISYDNTGDNPRNPSTPPVNVWNDESSSDEMFLTGYILSGDKPLDPAGSSFTSFLRSQIRSQFLRGLSRHQYTYTYTPDGTVIQAVDRSDGTSNYQFKSLIDEDQENSLEEDGNSTHH